MDQLMDMMTQFQQMAECLHNEIMKKSGVILDNVNERFKRGIEDGELQELLKKGPLSIIVKAHKTTHIAN